jgi:hypothetical protein
LIVGIIAIAVLAFAAWSLMGVAWALADLSGTKTIEGQVLRTREKTKIFNNSDGASGKLYFVAVYPGSGGEVVAWSVKPEVYTWFAQRQVVRVEITPMLGYVKDVTRP